MAFGYEYLMVYLPEVCSSSFLLFVHNPAGATKLRDYSNGSERQLTPFLSAAAVISMTEVGRTRFYCDPHITNGAGVGHWTQVTAELNRKWLHPNGVNGDAAAGSRTMSPASSGQGRASRGSQRQLQDYVNSAPEALTAAVLAELPPRLSDFGATIRWVSPLASANYSECRDGEFLAAIGEPDAASQLADFWPPMGPCWDALGVVTDPGGRLKPGAILVEAKSHIKEIYGSGCKAAGRSLAEIERALAETRAWLSVESDSDWLGPVYQYANRLAHLHFLRNKVRRPAWLVNLYFLYDPIGPTSEQEWRLEIQRVKDSLGLVTPIANAVDVFLPAMAQTETGNAESRTRPTVTAHAPGSPTGSSDPVASFRSWSQRWIDIASLSGLRVDNPDARINRLISLWDAPIPGSWERGPAELPDRLLDGRRYTRGDEADPRKGEHRIEHEILCQYFDDIVCLESYRLIDGVNAFPLVRDSAGGRGGNVEADLLLLACGPDGYRLLVCEVKDSANHAWYATVENLRQLKLLLETRDAGAVFRRRNANLALPPNVPVTGVVIAPREFFCDKGKKDYAVDPTHTLIVRVSEALDVELRLAVWDVQRREIREWQGDVGQARRSRSSPACRRPLARG